MPTLAGGNQIEDMLFTGGIKLSDSELALQRLTDSSGGPRSQKRPPVMWTWAAILTVVAVVGAVVFWLTQLTPTELMPSNTRNVPDLIGASQQAGIDTLKSMDLIGIPIQESNPDVPAGEIFKTDPTSEFIIEVGDTVKLFVSSGPVESTVPDVSGLPIADAKAEIEQLGLVIGLTSTVDDPGIAGGSVVSTSPAKGEKLVAGSAVDLVVSSGKVMAPNVVGQTMAMAHTLLDPTRLIVQEIPETSCKQQENLPIIAQSIAGQVEQRSTISIYYCAG